MVQTLSDWKVACGKMSMQSQFRRKVVLRKAKSQLGETLAAVCSVKPQEDKDAQSCLSWEAPGITKSLYSQPHKTSLGDAHNLRVRSTLNSSLLCPGIGHKHT